MSRIDRQNPVSRRQILKGAGVVVGRALVPRVAAGSQDGSLVSLNRSEYETLDTMCARIIPSDQNGPGAREARAARYIDRGFGGALSESLETYRQGLAALDTFSRSFAGDTFGGLSAPVQDTILAALEDGEASGFTPNSAQFFGMVRSHTIQGTFSDPFYGGNADFTGWDMIGYPGVRTAVPAQYQQMGGDHPPNHSSIYDSTMFDEGEI
jgi:gluconate 2-dehydrogenase gamma chain